MFLLDTNVVSELRKAGDGRADANVVAWASSVENALMHISAITVMEIEIGIQRIERRDVAQGTLLRTWLENHVLPFFEGRVVPIDAAVALHCAKLHVPDKKSERDALIAASALVHGMTVVTRNVGDFDGTGAKLLDPWV